MNFEDKFSKNVNIYEPKENINDNLLNQSIADEILNEDDLLNQLTPNDVLDKIEIYDSTVEVIGYVDSIESPRIVGNNQQYKFLKFFINNSAGRKIQIVAWNDDVDRVEQLIQSNFVVHLDGVQARMPKINMYNNGNVPYKLLIRKNTVITNLGKYHPKLEQIAPKPVTLSEVVNTSQCIILEAYIKTNFASIFNTKLNKNIGCGSITDGTYKVEVHITNFDTEKYAALKFNKGDKIEIVGTMQNSVTPGKSCKSIEASIVSANGCPTTDVTDTIKPIDTSTAHFPTYSTNFASNNTNYPPAFPPTNVSIPPPVNTMNHIVPTIHHIGSTAAIRPTPPSAPPSANQTTFQPYSYSTNASYFSANNPIPSAAPPRNYYPPQP